MDIEKVETFLLITFMDIKKKKMHFFLITFMDIKKKKLVF